MEKILLNCGRNSLRYIIRAYKIYEIYLPYYTCPSVWQAVRAEKCNVKFYHIDNNFLPRIQFPKNAYILYTNYFGINTNNVIKLASTYKNLIVDNSHGYNMPEIGIAGFNSIRKFLPVPDGSYLYTNKILDEKFENDTSYKTLKNTDFKNRNFDISENIKLASTKTIRMLKKIHFDKELRIEKFNKIHQKLKDKNLLDINLMKNDIPYIYPFLVEKEIKHTFETFWNPQPINTAEGYFQKYLIGIPLDITLDEQFLIKNLLA